jgi:orotidine-5'-phosphate decarboxylase
MSRTNEEYIFKLLTEFNGFSLAHLHDKIAAVKPNLAFFEAFGIPGLRAFARFCDEARGYDCPIIADAKRGDIGSTAAAYSAAFIGEGTFGKNRFPVFAADALTVNPYLGFDTLEPFVNDCKEYSKGLFVLVKTSNPGSASIQDVKTESGLTIAERVADHVAELATQLVDGSGYSSIGAVVGATYPDQARELRKRMPESLFLIPGMGAQGGTAADSVVSFDGNGRGGLINISRGLLSDFSTLDIDRESAAAEIEAKILAFNQQIQQALVGR